MPGRQHKLINGAIYHIYNKAFDRRKIFEDENLSMQFLNITRYYRSTNAKIRYSKFIKLSPDFQNNIYEKILLKNDFRISLLTYCIMPTHYHFVLRQNIDKGISTFISQIQNSYTRYYNLRTERSGPIFIRRFKSKPITSEELLKHVVRYILLNPFSSEILSNKNEILIYPWTSFHDFIDPYKNSMTEVEFILSLFKNNIERFKKFILDNADYQKTLELCKYSKNW